MKLFNILSKRTHETNNAPEMPAEPRPVFHTFDYEPTTEQFSVLFCHGTSSATLPAILTEGIRQPDLARVIDEVIALRPDLLAERDRLVEIVNREQLSMRARREETGVFATWFGNSTGIRMLAADMPNVVRHGGEVFAVAWKAIANELMREGRGELPRRFEDATVSVVLFRAAITAGMSNEMDLRTHDRTLIELADNLTADNLAWYDGAREVRFMSRLPPERIFGQEVSKTRCMLLARNFSHRPRVRRLASETNMSMASTRSMGSTETRERHR